MVKTKSAVGCFAVIIGVWAVCSPAAARAEGPHLYSITSPDGTLWGLIDETGKTVLAPRYAVITGFSDGVAGICTAKGLWGFINAGGRLIAEPRFSMPVPIMRMAWHGPYGHVNTITASEGMIRIRREEKYGFFDPGGAVIVEPKYHGAHGFSEGLAAVAVGKKWGFINKKGETAIAPAFDGIRTGFSDGIAVVVIGGKQGCIDTRGKTVLEAGYGYIEFLCGGALIAAWDKEHRHYRLFNKKGKPLTLAHEIDDVESIINSDGKINREIACIRSRWNWGIVDRQGRVLVEPQFDDPARHGGFRFYENLMSITGSTGKWKNRGGYLDTTGRIVVEPRFRKVYPFSEGLAAVRTDEGGYAFIDTTGKIVITIPPPYEPGIFGPLFTSGRALLCSPRGNPYALIDRQGAVTPIDKNYDVRSSRDGLMEIALHHPPHTLLGVMDHNGKWVLGPGNYRELYIRDGGVIFVKYGSRRLKQRVYFNGFSYNRIENFGYLDRRGKTLWKGIQYFAETEGGR